MKTSNRKILSLIMVLMLVLTAALVSSCANNHPIDESKLPKLEEQTEQQAQQQDQSQQQPQQEQAQQQQQQQQQPQPQQQQPAGPQVSEAQAINIVLKKVPGATQSNLVSFGSDYDDGRWLYEGELRYNGLEYDFEIDGMTGNILEWEIDD